MRRTGRDDTPATPLNNSTLPGRPPQPSWRILASRAWSGWRRRAPDRVASLKHANRAAALALDAQGPRPERAEQHISRNKRLLPQAADASCRTHMLLTRPMKQSPGWERPTWGRVIAQWGGGCAQPGPNARSCQLTAARTCEGGDAS
jgi:hypothetical protein